MQFRKEGRENDYHNCECFSVLIPEQSNIAL